MEATRIADAAPILQMSGVTASPPAIARCESTPRPNERIGHLNDLGIRSLPVSQRRLRHRSDLCYNADNSKGIHDVCDRATITMQGIEAKCRTRDLKLEIAAPPPPIPR